MTAQHKTKAIWAECERVAEVLEVKKTEVYQYLYPTFKGTDTWQQLLNNDEDAIHAVKSSIEWRRIKEPPQVKVHRPEESEERGSKLGKPKTRDEKLKLAMWFISRFDSPDEALHVMQAAVQACNSLDRPVPPRGD